MEFEWKKLLESEKVSRMNKTLLIRQLDGHADEALKEKSETINNIFPSITMSLGPVNDSKEEKNVAQNELHEFFFPQERTQ